MIEWEVEVGAETIEKIGTNKNGAFSHTDVLNAVSQCLSEGYDKFDIYLTNDLGHYYFKAEGLQENIIKVLEDQHPELKKLRS